MKQVIKNQYLKGFRFSSLQEASTFLGNQAIKKCLALGDTYGDNYYCYICYNSLTAEKQFVLSFSSDESDENLNFLFWDERELLVLDTGKNIYLIDNNLFVKAFFEITTPLIGLYLINNSELLLLEEGFMRLVDYNGKILESELFDLIEDFAIKDSRLVIQANGEQKVFELK
jgi:hypothetical protein